MKHYFYIAFLVLFFSCSEKKEKVVAEDEMKATEINDTTNNNEIAIVKDTILTNEDSLKFISLKIDKKLSFEKKVNLFLEKYTLIYTKTGNDKTIIPERYENSFGVKIGLKKKTPVKYGKVEGVYPIAQLWFYQYKDSISCRNVLNNWLQCYGFDCTPVEFMKDLPAIKTTPSFLIFNEKEIIFLQYQCEHIGNNWNDMRKELENLFGSKTYYTISLNDCGKKLVWKKEEK